MRNCESGMKPIGGGVMHQKVSHAKKKFLNSNGLFTFNVKVYRQYEKQTKTILVEKKRI